jgi:stage V sporulation protein R
MELIDQHTKKIMEGCKERALDAGLRFEKESLEYIVTNRDLIELTPKVMIPTLYDYWVHDVEVLKEKGRYELYPSNPYETVINTRPAISFYNDNNPDWMNVMIFYHVLGHIDFFQNNFYYRHTWDYDFTGRALSDKRMIANLRSEKGRWVDYIIEFSRGIDNLVGYHNELARIDRPKASLNSERLDFYFDVFLQDHKKVRVSEYIKEIEQYNQTLRGNPESGERSFFLEINKKYPEFEVFFQKSREKRDGRKLDLLQHILEHSPSLKKESNQWMKSVLEVIRNTSVFLQPQIRTKIMNEGWASYWHELLFLQDDRIKGHEVDFARTHAGVTSLPRVGLNPYALGMRLFQYIEEVGNKGKYSIEFRKLLDARERDRYDTHQNRGRELIFKIRESFCDFLFIHTFVDQDFVNRNRLFVVGKRLNRDRMVWEYYVKSRKAEDYRQMLIDAMYHPPFIEISEKKGGANGTLYLDHHFEGKPLVKEFIPNTMLGIEYLWGGSVQLETSEVVSADAGGRQASGSGGREEHRPVEIRWERVRYTMKDRQLQREVIETPQ